jgi:hypothetical protein
MAAQRKSVNKVGTAKGRGSSELRLPGEKSVRSTSKAVPVKRTRRAGEEGPTDPAAVDRRRQIVGTDDPGAAPSARRGSRAR